MDMLGVAVQEVAELITDEDVWQLSFVSIYSCSYIVSIVVFRDFCSYVHKVVLRGGKKNFFPLK